MKVSQRRTFMDCWCETFCTPNALPVTNQQCQSTERITTVTNWYTQNSSK